MGACRSRRVLRDGECQCLWPGSGQGTRPIRSVQDDHGRCFRNTDATRYRTNSHGFDHYAVVRRCQDHQTRPYGQRGQRLLPVSVETAGHSYDPVRIRPPGIRLPGALVILPGCRGPGRSQSTHHPADRVGIIRVVPDG